MNQENFNEYITNARAAASVKNYETALEWYRKALEENGASVEALSETGAVCMTLEKHGEAFDCFQKAREADPGNGDNDYNLGNAYFFRGDYGKALELYSEAETKPCSDDVRQRIYYQLAMLCSIRQDVRSALVNFRKYEDADKTGMAALDPAVISEKIKLYMMDNDYDNAARCSVQWISVAPAELRCYMVYFGILMAKGDYDTAEKVLADAEKYAEVTENARLSVEVERASLLAARAENDPERSEEFLQKAYELLRELKEDNSLPRHRDITLTFAEICLRMERYEEAIKEALSLLPREKTEEFKADIRPPEYEQLDEGVVEEMIENDMQSIDERISSGELSEDLGESAEIYYDEDGNPVRDYPDELFAGMDGVRAAADDAAESAPADSGAERADDPEGFNDRIYFVLLSCYAALEDYKNAHIFGGLLKHSENEYYACFGRYTEAFSMRKLDEYSEEAANSAYEKTIAYFRSRMMADPGNSSAVIFRARMYAESGKFAKAEEMAGLLIPDKKQAVMEYISECRKEQQ